MSRTRTAAALFTVPLIAVGVLGVATAPAGAAPHPAKPLTCRGEGVDSGAEVRVRTERVIDAPLRTVWKLQTDVERWPDWQSHVTSMDRLDHGPLRAGWAGRGSSPRTAQPAPPPPPPVKTTPTAAPE
ncbi:SRPBCC family protein, partial [Streptomyces anulatus]|uniref:SRPBCC family protein n=1 Tax=Streptomyces anulatus TaxID=1892 RepID=UPI00364E44B7